MNEPVKLCINCKYLKDVKCHRPDGVSLVTGLPIFSAQYAEDERRWNNVGCGEKAKFFELKEEV